MFRAFICALAILTSTSASLAQTPAQTSAQTPNYGWYRYTNSDTVFIFTHGLFSDSRVCWTDSAGHYWPQILKDDARFGDVSIFLGGYTTTANSSMSTIGAAADELLARLRNPPPTGQPQALSKSNIIFVAHSLGGVVVREMISRNIELFQSKKLGIVLLASPSRGSEWATRATYARLVLKNKLVEQLMTDSKLLDDIDVRWSAIMRDNKLPFLKGADAFETLAVTTGVLGMILGSKTIVVNADTQKTYFGSARLIPDVDHFSISKPSSVFHPVHDMLWDFYNSIYLPSISPAAGSKPPAAAIEEEKTKPHQQRVRQVALTPTPIGAKDLSERQQLESFAPNFVKAWVAGKPSDIGMSEMVGYYNRGILKREDVLKDMQSFMADFASRDYRLLEKNGKPDITVSQLDKARNTWNVIAPFTFKAESKTRILSGHAKYDMDLVIVNGKAELFGIDIIDKKLTTTYKKQ